jgi:hypothetical protein
MCETETFLKLRDFRGVQQCEVAHDEHAANTGLRFEHLDYGLLAARSFWSERAAFGR